MAVDTVEQNTETTKLEVPVSSYQVIESKQLASDTRFIASDLYAEEGITPPAPPPQVPTVSAPPQSHTEWFVAKARVAKAIAAKEEAALNKTSTKMVAALGVGLGLLSGLAFVAFVLQPAKAADNSYDMGSVTSTTTGLKGHLVTNWTDRLNYKLTIEPSDVSELDAFATTINNPPRPIELNLHLIDVSGVELCDTPVLLKFDPLRNLPNVVPTNPSPSAAKRNARFEEQAAQTEAEVQQSLNKAHLVGGELQREHGKDMFQPVKDGDGQIASLAAQGTLPCTKKQYQSAASWGFTTNFPSVLQTAGIGGIDDLGFVGVPGTSDDSTGKRKANHGALPHSHFVVEQDDALVNYQAASGIMETRGGKQFLVERREIVAATLKGIDLPVPIHYRCDQLGACAVAGLNAGIQRAWLER
jgi:hypothetical protein